MNAKRKSKIEDIQNTVEDALKTQNSEQDTALDYVFAKMLGKIERGDYRVQTYSWGEKCVVVKIFLWKYHSLAQTYPFRDRLQAHIRYTLQRRSDISSTLFGVEIKLYGKV